MLDTSNMLKTRLHTHRTKTDERIDFSYDEKLAISKKSDDRCCRCGKLVYWGYGATIDHFVPISKGGSNDHRNLIMTCQECNKTKSNMIVLPGGAYTHYLKPEAEEQLAAYFTEYMEEFSYLDRHNILPTDIMEIPFIGTVNSISTYKHPTNYQKHITLYLKKNTIRDLDTVITYIHACFKKYKAQYTLPEIHAMVEFFFKYGAIYTLSSASGTVYLTLVAVISIPVAIETSSTANGDLDARIIDYDDEQYINANYAKGSISLINPSVNIIPFIRYPNKPHMMDVAFQSINMILDNLCTVNDLYTVPSCVIVPKQDPLNGMFQYTLGIFTFNRDCRRMYNNMNHVNKDPELAADLYAYEIKNHLTALNEYFNVYRFYSRENEQATNKIVNNQLKDYDSYSNLDIYNNVSIHTFFDTFINIMPSVQRYIRNNYTYTDGTDIEYKDCIGDYYDDIVTLKKIISKHDQIDAAKIGWIFKLLI